ncbi:MAG: substrate-binding domain-containing protein [Alphaproteobacteria bacterium]|nr:substrate-binding domain-containing protein [Alphaproteobacteria bacterium]
MKLYFFIPVFILSTFSSAFARDQIRIVGSSTVFPFATVVAENFSKKKSFKTPIVESTGTGAGIKLFCSGLGEDFPDISGASRKIKSSELEDCHKNGVKNIMEIEIGFDGIILASSKEHKPYQLSLKQIWQALAKKIPQNGKWVDNPYNNWNDIDPSLSPDKIEVLGPPPSSGTRDAFVELVLDKGCEEFSEIKNLKPEEKKVYCQSIREDGHYIEAGENDNLIVQKLTTNPKALGIFGYSFLEQNSDKIEASTINKITPTYNTISNNSYPIARSLYIYVKKDHLNLVPGLKEYMTEMTSDDASSEDGYLIEKGLIPLPAERHKKITSDVLSLKTI